MIGIDTYSEIIFLKIYMIEEIKIQNFPKTRLNHQKGRNMRQIFDDLSLFDLKRLV